MLMQDLLAEYLTNGNSLEASRCLMELNVPYYHHELVKRALVKAADDSKKHDAPLLLKLLQELSASGAVNQVCCQLAISLLHACKSFMSCSLSEHLWRQLVTATFVMRHRFRSATAVISFWPKKSFSPKACQNSIQMHKEPIALIELSTVLVHIIYIHTLFIEYTAVCKHAFPIACMGLKPQAGPKQVDYLFSADMGAGTGVVGTFKCTSEICCRWIYDF